MADVDINDLWAIIQQQRDEIDDLKAKVNRWEFNGAEDMFGGGGFQRFGAGVTRLDNEGMQLTTPSGSQTVKSIYFVSEFGNTSDAYGQIVPDIGTNALVTYYAFNDNGDDAHVVTQATARGVDNLFAALVANDANAGGPSAQVKVSNSLDGNNTQLIELVGQLRLEQVTADYSSLADGAIWYRADLDKFRARINGTTYNLAVEDALVIGDASELTISSGAITITGGYHLVDTEGDAANDDLDTINGGVDGQVLVLSSASNSRTVTCRDGNGNLALAGNATLNSIQDTLTLIYSAGQGVWLQLAFANNG